MDLIDFLKTAKDDVTYIDAFKEVHIVLGNSACDLDSAVSAILYSYYLAKVTPEDTAIPVIPVLNIPSSDYPLRTEITPFLSSHKVPEDLLTFRDTFDLHALAEDKRLKLTLVDHNVLSEGDKEVLDPCVVQIIDHHENGRGEEEEGRELGVQLEPVGSCVTLVAERILSEAEQLVDERIAALATGTILLDTVNLSREAGRTTDKDESIVQQLERFCPNIVHQDVFESLQRSKFDVSGLSAMDVVRKDFKSVSLDGTTIGLSSIPCSIEALLHKSEVWDIFPHFAESRDLTALLLLSAFQGGDGTLERGFGIFSLDGEVRNKLVQHFTSEAAGLRLEGKSQRFINFVHFSQGNVNASRKFILPLAQRFLEHGPEPGPEPAPSESQGEEGTAPSNPEKQGERLADGESDSVAGVVASDSKETTEDSDKTPQSEATPGQGEAGAGGSSPATGEATATTNGGNERGEAEGAEEDDMDNISIKISRKDPPMTPPEAVVGEVAGRGRVDTLVSETSIGDLDYDDDDEDEADREAKGAHSGATASPNRKRLSANLGLGLDDASITTQDLDAAFPAVLTPTSADMSWDEDSRGEKSPRVAPIPEYSARDELNDRWRWRQVKINDHEYTIDNHVIEPYKKVLSHGGYYGNTMNAIIVVASCYLPDKSRLDYDYVMHHLFLYVVSSLELLVAQDYMIVYFHGAAPRSKIPSLGWMKKCYQMIDRRLKKNLKGLYIVHPTPWLKTIMLFTKPFISAKFYRKVKFIHRLGDLTSHVSMEYIFVPEEVKKYDQARHEKN